jgi:hypothetical protein
MFSAMIVVLGFDSWSPAAQFIGPISNEAAATRASVRSTSLATVEVAALSSGGVCRSAQSSPLTIEITATTATAMASQGLGRGRLVFGVARCCGD